MQQKQTNRWWDATASQGTPKTELNEWLVHQLRKPTQCVDVVIDTDTYNEVDDQYALAYLMKSEEKCNVKAIYAAPFFNAKSSSPADGMEQSYAEILNVLTLLGKKSYQDKVYRGSCDYLSSETDAVPSDAAQHLATIAMEYTAEKPLYVIAIGAITNIASAILLNPEIRARMVVIWLGGNAREWPNNQEFNLLQDVAAARVVFDSGVPVVHLPCQGVVSAFTVSGADLMQHLKGHNALCDYLVKVTFAEIPPEKVNDVWTRVIWDVTAVGWLLGDFMDDRLEHSPIPQYDHHWSFDFNRHLYRYVYHIHRDELLADLFRKLKK